MKTIINLAGLTSSQGISMLGNADSSSGFAVSGAGYINGDNYKDIIIGAPGYGNPANIGAIYVIYGGNSLSNFDLTDLGTKGIIISDTIVSQRGWSVSSAGDINNDGYDDIIIGGYGIPAGAPEVYVVYGGGSLNNIVLSSMTAAQGFSISGANSAVANIVSVSGAGDVNNDGVADIIIGVPNASPNNRYLSGASYVIYGGVALNSLTSNALDNLPNTQGFTINGATAGDSSGYQVSGVGDVNGDGYADVIIGAPLASKLGRNAAGAAYVIYGGLGINIDLACIDASTCTYAGFAIYGAVGGYWTGSSVSGAGDINKDGFDDIIIGAQEAKPNGKLYAGESYVIYGGNALSNIDLLSLNSNQGFKIYGASAGDRSGIRVSGAGDVNKDGFDDMLVGGSSSGKAYLIYGKNSTIATSIDLASLTSAQGFSTNSSPGGDGSLTAVSATDLNGDGYSDLIIGSYATNSGAGTTYLLYGAESGFVTSSPTSVPSSPTSVPSSSPTSAPSSPTNNPSNVAPALPIIVNSEGGSGLSNSDIIAIAVPIGCVVLASVLTYSFWTKMNKCCCSAAHENHTHNGNGDLNFVGQDIQYAKSTYDSPEL